MLSANGMETPRSVLAFEIDRFPAGLANSSGLVGKYLMSGGGAHAYGIFEHPL